MFDLSKPLIELLSDLIMVKSETGDEKELCDLLENTLNQYDGKLTRVKDSLLFSMDFNREKTIALVGHIDTVPVAESSITPTIKDGELWGRGSCDMKSGVASILKVLHDISLGKIEPNYNISIIFYENEEGALPNGINFLLDGNLLENIDFAYILEPTEGKYSVGCMGSLAVKKEVFGIPAHSANPKKGKNALNESMDIFQNINKMNSLISKTEEIDGFNYYETVNVTTFQTENRAFNVIPAKASMVANYRFSPKRSSKEALELLFKYYGNENITVLDEADSCYIGSSGDYFLLSGIEREIMQAWTDIAQLTSAGIPAINFGAGSIEYAHKPDERISIDELNEFYTVLLKHL